MKRTVKVQMKCRKRLVDRGPAVVAKVRFAVSEPVIVKIWVEGVDVGPSVDVVSLVVLSVVVMLVDLVGIIGLVVV